MYEKDEGDWINYYIEALSKDGNLTRIMDELQAERNYYVSGWDYNSPITYKKTKDGMYSVTKELKELMNEWLETVEFKVHKLSMADILLIKQYLKQGKYDQEGREFLNTIRERWISYKNKNK